MKTNLFKMSALAIMMALTACTKEEMVVLEYNDPKLLPGEDVIEVSLTSTVLNRAARPIGCSKADNNVNRIGFKFLKDGKTEDTNVTLEGVLDSNGELDKDTYPVSDDGIIQINNSKEITQDETNDSKIKIKFSGLTEGNYTVIAYGFNATDDKYTFPNEITTATGTETFQQPLEYNNIKTTIEEIFAGGQHNVAVNQHGKFEDEISITLTRQVAGMLAYFKNVPVYVDNKKVEFITVSTTVKMTGFKFPAAFLDDASYNGIGDASNAASLNESVSFDNANLTHYLTFTMSRASNYDLSLSNGDYYTFNSKGNKGEKYLLADGMAPIAGLECDDNTLFGSCFMLPFAGDWDLSAGGRNAATLNICYWTIDNGTKKLIKSVPLKTKNTTTTSLSDEAYQYNIKCNNFYSIGTKETLNNDDPNDEDDPISIDEPTGYESIMLDIDEGWQATHSLVNYDEETEE